MLQTPDGIHVEENNKKEIKGRGGGERPGVGGLSLN